MYRVAVCDDEHIFCESEKEVCGVVLERMGVPFLVDAYQSGEDFLRRFFENPQLYDLVLLDIIMDSLNGMEIAGKIREENKDITIIFITSSTDYTLQGYDVRALHYLVKPVDSSMLERLIREDYRERFEKMFVVLDTASGALKVDCKDIVYVEISGRKLAVNMRDKVVYHMGRMNDMLALLPGDVFVRCHQSFAVNINHIRELRKNSAVMQDQRMVPVSRMHVKELQRMFLRTFQ